MVPADTLTKSKMLVKNNQPVIESVSRNVSVAQKPPRGPNNEAAVNLQ